MTIVEFGYFYAMPYGAAMAAALGARVIKLEDGNGDPHRTLVRARGRDHKTTAGKESLSVDLRTPEGRADRPAGRRRRPTSSSPASAPAWPRSSGSATTSCRRLNPRLLYVHAAGYGTDGPYAHRALYAQAAQAVGGSFGRQVGYWADPGANVDMSVIELQAVVLPRLDQVVDGDSNAALAVLAALGLGDLPPARTGEGQFLRTSMIGGNAWAYSDDFCTYDGKPPSRCATASTTARAPSTACTRRPTDGWVCLAVRTDAEFGGARRQRSGRRSWPPTSGSPTARRGRERRRRCTASREAGSPTSRRAEWEAMLPRGAGRLRRGEHARPARVHSFDPVLRETGLTVAVEHPLFGEMVRAAPPVAFSETPGRVAPPCVRGEHNRTILAELGYSEGDIAKLEELNVVIPSA